MQFQEGIVSTFNVKVALYVHTRKRRHLPFSNFVDPNSYVTGTAILAQEGETVFSPTGRPKGGRPPLPLEAMLRVYFLQNWDALGDPMAEEMLYDNEAMRGFAGIELGDNRISDETTILNVSHLLARHGLTEGNFANVNAHLADKGIRPRSGTLGQ